MAEQARAAMGIDELTVVADRGYFKGEQVLQCDQAGITPIVPKTLTSNSLADGRFDRAKVRSPDGRAVHCQYWDARTRRALRD